MPSKKKYNARFPPARIKKIMQTDEEVGKVAAPVPVIISRVLELFVKNLLGKASEFAANNQARTLLSIHLTQAISSDPRLHFLQETVRQHSKTGDGLDLQRGNAAAEDGDAAASSAIAMMQAAPPPYRHQQSSALAVSSPTAAPVSYSVPPCITSSISETMPLGASPAEGAIRLPARGRGRGRPRGRPPKRPLPDLTPISNNFTPTVPTNKRGRGRPRKQAASPTFVGTDGVTVSSPGMNGPFLSSLTQEQPFFSYPDPQKHSRSPSLIFPGGLTVANSYGISSTAESAASCFSFTVGQSQFGLGSASITCNNSDGTSSSQVGGRELSRPVAGNCFQQTLPSSPLSAPMTISRVGGGSRESPPHLSSNGSLVGLGASGGTILTAPSSQSNPFFSGIKIEIPSLPAAHLPLSIFSHLSSSPVTSGPTNICPSEVSSTGKKQRRHTPESGNRCISSTNSFDTPNRNDSTNGKVASGATFTFGSTTLGEGVSSPSASSDASSFTGVAVDFSSTATCLPMRLIQSASSSNLDEDYDS